VTQPVIDTSPAYPYAGGCIRLTNAGPEWHINPQHVTVGFNPYIHPTINADGELHANMLTAFPVIAAIAEPDETISSRGIEAGISGAVADVDIWFSKAGRKLDLNDAADYALVRGTYANVWIYIPRYIELVQ
jgi:hypothetical protein